MIGVSWSDQPSADNEGFILDCRDKHIWIYCSRPHKTRVTDLANLSKSNTKFSAFMQKT